MDRYWSTQAQKWIYPTWKVEYGNDTGPTDESFQEWWEVTESDRSFRTTTKEHAEWLCNLLNGDVPE